MPAKHKYKCLNPECGGTLFIAMNSPAPACPRCDSIKSENWGQDNGPLGIYRSMRAGPTGLSETTRHTDSTIQHMADRYGLSDISNKDGKAAKGRAMPAPTGPMVKVGGYEVSADAAAAGACTRLPMTVPLKAAINSANSAKSPMLGGMTRVVAEHKGRA